MQLASSITLQGEASFIDDDLYIKSNPSLIRLNHTLLRDNKISQDVAAIIGNTYSDMLRILYSSLLPKLGCITSYQGHQELSDTFSQWLSKKDIPSHELHTREMTYIHLLECISSAYYHTVEKNKEMPHIDPTHILNILYMSFLGVYQESYTIPALTSYPLESFVESMKLLYSGGRELSHHLQETFPDMEDLFKTVLAPFLVQITYEKKLSVDANTTISNIAKELNSQEVILNY